MSGTSMQESRPDSDLLEAAGHPIGRGVVKPDYDPRLANEDLAPLNRQTWGWYQVFCMWMSDVHSVGGYLFAASLFALGLAGWQVLVCLIVGIVIVMYLTNWVAARPASSLASPTPWSVDCRSASTAPTSPPSSGA